MGCWAAAACFAMLAAAPAHACEFSWKPGWSPKEIKDPERTDVRRVVGVFHITAIEGQAGQDGYLDSGWISGRVETLRGTGWDMIQSYDRFSIECGASREPTRDAKGVFWIARARKDGRYEMLAWEGEYLPDPPSQSTDAK